jgi:hypothetical protein
MNSPLVQRTTAALCLGECRRQIVCRHMAAPTNLQREILLANPEPSTHGTNGASRLSPCIIDYLVLGLIAGRRL